MKPACFALAASYLSMESLLFIHKKTEFINHIFTQYYGCSIFIFKYCFTSTHPLHTNNVHGHILYMSVQEGTVCLQYVITQDSSTWPHNYNLQSSLISADYREHNQIFVVSVEAVAIKKQARLVNMPWKWNKADSYRRGDVSYLRRRR